MKRKTLLKIIATIIVLIVISSFLILRGTSFLPFKTFGNMFSSYQTTQTAQAPGTGSPGSSVGVHP